MAFKPPSVTQGAPSGPTMTPCGAEPLPSAMVWVLPVLGSNSPNSPDPCAVYQTDPFCAGATSCGAEPDGTRNSCRIVLAELCLTCAYEGSYVTVKVVAERTIIDITKKEHLIMQLYLHKT